MRFRVKNILGDDALDEAGIPYVSNKNVYFGKGKQRRRGVVTQLLAKALQGVGDIIGV